MTEANVETRHFFVDEAGDLTLFSRRGTLLVGSQGVSRVFMVGVAHLPDPAAAEQALSRLRAELLADRYFRNVPSMQPEAGKTALLFHAKDDLPEVRREVFKLLPDLGAKVQVAIRRKVELAAEARRLFATLGRKVTADQVYDDLVKRLFKNLLHKADSNRILFSRRGKSARYAALHAAIARAKSNFERKWRLPSDRPTEVASADPSVSAGLQVIDYYLWALQRFYERGEERFFALLAPAYRLIMDLDDTRQRGYGEWYSDRNPLTPQKLKPVAG